VSQRTVDVCAYNRAAWNNEVALGNAWTIPVDQQSIERARNGDLELYLTPTRPVPLDWLPSELAGLAVLCLAGGGGQQGPLLAAAGARVTVFDNSDRQLDRDRSVARQFGLQIETIQGDMADLSVFGGESFGLIVHPTSNVYVPNIRPVWKEAFRVLAPGGTLIAAFESPVRHLFDTELAERGVLRVRHRLPYSDLRSLTPAELRRRLQTREPLAFGHLLTDQIGGQIDAGFLIAGFYEDRFEPGANDALSRFIPTFAATRAIKST
jgi:SAM-dependent methyltransferase